MRMLELLYVTHADDGSRFYVTRSHDRTRYFAWAGRQCKSQHYSLAAAIAECEQHASGTPLECVECGKVLPSVTVWDGQCDTCARIGAESDREHQEATVRWLEGSI